MKEEENASPYTPRWDSEIKTPDLKPANSKMEDEIA